MKTGRWSAPGGIPTPERGNDQPSLESRDLLAPVNLPPLPINEILPGLRGALSAHRRVVLTAPTGSGKTTIVPLALLQEPWLEEQSILMLEPRRLAARLSALRMAELLGERPGQRVGYRIRHESNVSRETRIEVVTEGILTRRLQGDPELRGVGLVIFDEFHERNLQADLALALCLDVAGALRDDLRILVMSATLEADALSAFLDKAPVVRGEGRSYPVEVRYQERDSELRPVDLALQGIRRALKEQSGDILAFLPGTGEIRRVQEALNQGLPEGVVARPLYADLSRAEQDLALFPDPAARRVVLATSVAETSLTIEGIDTVVDLGLSRLSAFDPNSGLTRLETRRCSKAAADQRAGRAGRLGPGVCYRLWTEARQNQLIPATPPEIRNADLSQLLLETARWGAADPAQLRWLDPPAAGAVAQARELLQRLDLLDAKGRINSGGERVCELGVHPRLGRLLLTGEAEDCAGLAADLAALLSERDILGGPGRPVDLELRLRLLREWRERKRGGEGVDPAGCKRVDQLSKQLRRSLRGNGEKGDAGGLLLTAFPDRLAGRTGADPLRYKLALGGGARLPEADLLQGRPFLVIAAMDAGQRDGRIFSAVPVTAREIEHRLGPHLQRVMEVAWRDNGVRASELVRYEALVLEERPARAVDPEAIKTALLQGIRQQGLDCLPWGREARDWQARLLCLRQWEPEAGWPDCSDAALLEGLADWLGPWLEGMTRLDHLQRLDLEKVLRGLLDWKRQQEMDRAAPTHIPVPSGSRKRLEYKPGEPPVLAVKLQEMFGLHDTPRVGNGKVPVMVHLLSPAQRPVQVTQDLRGFWQRTYQEVKKELKGRYPKHYWPDDPFSAIPTARVRPSPDIS
ncbi:MAG: ATP-dependent helicase HrpB [Gammaproteobacteria bacterium]|nr:ATP-dependent helicase HrpB [Gammaproteobacteria bacterium]MBU1653904.1 ATP-dependent helicase HrpB [Gammaproteobacteria bacterium]MBU1962345.1 ATP-dependent helicase HrpB [Gammaproteobacteria bacterium]